MKSTTATTASLSSDSKNVQSDIQRSGSYQEEFEGYSKGVYNNSYRSPNDENLVADWSPTEEAKAKWK